MKYHNFHVLERDGDFIIINPRSFTWIRTSGIGWVLFQSFVEGETGTHVVHRLGISTRDVEEFRDYLYQEGFLPNEQSGDIAPRPDYENTPIGCTILLTNRCQMNCKHCFYASGNLFRKEDELSTAQFMRIIGRLAEAGIRYIAFTGGEPLLRRDIWQLMSFALDKGLKIHLLTNGLLLSHQKAEWLAEHGVQIQISLDGSTPMTYNNIRGFGFDRVIRNIEMLADAGCHVAVSIVPMKENLDEIPDIIEFASSMGVRTFHLSLLERSGRAEQIYQEVRPSDEELVHLCKHLYETYYGSGASKIELPFLDVMIAKLYNPPNRHACKIGREVIAISWDGNLYPCSGLVDERHKIGSLLSSDLMELYYSPRMNYVREQTMTHRIEKCRDCPFILPCLGGCRSKAYVLDKRLDTPDPYCGFLKEMWTYLLWKISEIQIAERDEFEK
ncbi:MAG: radical SAM protein [Candidatus Methanomethyliaceae archaeon]